MKISWNKKYTIAIIIVDLILIILFIILVDILKLIESTFFISVLANLLVGVLTIMGGFGLAYLMIEQSRIIKEKENTIAIRETLINIKKQLLPWLYDFAFRLSTGYESIQIFRDIIKTGYPPSDSEFDAHKPLFEDVFAIIKYDHGHKLTGTEAEFSKIDSFVIDAQYLLGVLMAFKAKGMLKRIRYEIEETPDFRGYVSRDTAKVRHIDNLISERYEELKSWESKEASVSITSEIKNIAIRHNLRNLGAQIYYILLSISEDIIKLSSK